MMQTSMKRRITITLDIDTSSAGTTGVRRVSNDAWVADITWQANKFGMIPTLAHELGHIVAYECGSPASAKDPRRFGAEAAGMSIEGNNMIAVENEAWDIGEMIAFRESRVAALRTYEAYRDRTMTVVNKLPTESNPLQKALDALDEWSKDIERLKYKW